MYTHTLNQGFFSIHFFCRCFFLNAAKGDADADTCAIRSIAQVAGDLELPQLVPKQILVYSCLSWFGKGILPKMALNHVKDL